MKILVVAHVFYPQLWPELAGCICSLVTDAREIVYRLLRHILQCAILV